MSKHRNHSYDNNTESKAKNMTYYDVLNVPYNSQLTEIKKQFRKLAIIYHPDQKDTGDASIFALVARAYECLSDSHKRDEYDRMLALEKKARKIDFVNQKKAFDEFIKAQQNDISSKNIEHARSKFRIDWEDMDRKRGAKTFSKFNDKNLGTLGHLEEKAMSSRDSSQRLKDMEMEREQEEIEFMQPEIFKKGKFDKETFNALFELKYKHDKDDQLVKHSLPSAFNDVSESPFVSCEGNYDDIFDENNNNLFNINDEKVTVSKDDMNKVKGLKTQYKSHKIKTDDYKNDIEKRLREREADDKLYESRKMQDFDQDNNMGGYGFLHEVGLTGKELDWDREEIDEQTFRKLIAYRQSEEKLKKH